MLTLVTGGARSGKSTFAENNIKKLNGKTTYIATALPFDQGMKDRINKHRKNRPCDWKTIEQYKDFKSLENNQDFIQADNVLLDCLTLLITNQMLDYNISWEEVTPEQLDHIESEIKDQVKILLDLLETKNSFIVTNEVGLGVVPINYFANYFRDIAGRINQYVAKRADNVYITFCGIELKLK